MAMSAARPVPPRAAMHVRDHRSLLADVERRALVWLARRVPAWIGSDHLTALGAAGMVAGAAAFAGAAWSRWSLALVPLCLAVNWLGDSLDGTVARVRRQERPRYGFYLDHVVDLFNTTVLFLGLALSGIASPGVAVAVMVGFLLLAAESFLATHTLGVFRMASAGVGPTELRLLLSAGAIAAIWHPVVEPFGLGPVRLFDLGGSIGAAGMLVVFVVTARRNARALGRIEPLPRSEA